MDFRHVAAIAALVALAVGGLAPEGHQGSAGPADAPATQRVRPEQVVQPAVSVEIAAPVAMTPDGQVASIDPAPVAVQSPSFPAEAVQAAFVPDGGPNAPPQVAVHANHHIAAVEFQVDYGEWQPMDMGQATSYAMALAGGPWTHWGSQQAIPNGSLVVFRTTAADGRVAYSHPYAWPPSGE